MSGEADRAGWVFPAGSVVGAPSVSVQWSGTGTLSVRLSSVTTRNPGAAVVGTRGGTGARWATVGARSATVGATVGATVDGGTGTASVVVGATLEGGTVSVVSGTEGRR